MAAEAKRVIEVDSIVKDFRPGFGLRVKRVLHGVSFDVSEGEIFGFVGPNGAGKTTALKVMMGLIRPTSGRATILGADVSETRFRQHIGFLPENPYFYTYLTAREILHFYARLSDLSSERRHERVETLLEWVGLEPAADARLKTYSKGMLQRVGIAQALVHDPSVIFLDEPMSGLDPIGRKEIRDIILRLKSQGKTVFMNTHILSDVEMICDRVAIIVKGKICYEGRIQDFLGEEAMCSDIVISSLSPNAAEAIERDVGVEFRGIGEHVEIQVRDKAVNTVLEHVLRDGADVVSVSKHRVTLESIFLDTVERSESGELAEGSETPRSASTDDAAETGGDGR
jgi:ABC-2 type transport system ATP-binding protein